MTIAQVIAEIVSAFEEFPLEEGISLEELVRVLRELKERVSGVEVEEEDEEGEGGEVKEGEIEELRTLISSVAAQLEGPRWENELLDEGLVGEVFAVLVWRDGGASDGNKTTQCNRTYEVKTLDSAVTLGEDMTPNKVRPNVGRMQTPPVDGAGVVGEGYREADGTFCLYDANECIYAEACP